MPLLLTMHAIAASYLCCLSACYSWAGQIKSHQLPADWERVHICFHDLLQGDFQYGTFAYS